jgi:hypothetical protein
MKFVELLEWKADEFEGEISDISGTAQGEEKIEKQLAEVV